MSAPGRRRVLQRAALAAAGIAAGWVAAPLRAQKPASPAGADNPTHLIDGVLDIEWGWTPRETLATMLGKGGPQPTVVWVGRVVDVRAGKPLKDAKGDDSVLEILAAYMPLARPGPFALAPPIRLRPETGDHFVVSLRAPPLNDALLANLRQSMLDATHYAVVVGSPRFVAPFARHSAIFLQTQRATVSQRVKVDIVRE